MLEIGNSFCTILHLPNSALLSISLNGLWSCGIIYHECIFGKTFCHELVTFYYFLMKHKKVCSSNSTFKWWELDAHLLKFWQRFVKLTSPGIIAGQSCMKKKVLPIGNIYAALIQRWYHEFYWNFMKGVIVWLVLNF